MLQEIVSNTKQDIKEFTEGVKKNIKICFEAKEKSDLKSFF